MEGAVCLPNHGSLYAPISPKKGGYTTGYIPRHIESKGKTIRSQNHLFPKQPENNKHIICENIKQLKPKYNVTS